MLKNTKLKFSLFFLLIFFLLPNLGLAAREMPANVLGVNDLSQIELNEQTVNLYFFYSETCPHCQKEALFLSQLKQEYGDKIQIYSFEVTTNSANAELFKKFGQAYEIDISSVPILFIANKYVVGYQSDEYTGAEIKNKLDGCLALECSDPGHKILFPDHECEKDGKGDKQPCPEDEQSKIVKIPILGEINLQNTSLFMATFVLGVLDGFNPCAMWVLIFLISLLLGVESVRRRWILGLTFIAASALVYFLFMVAWLNIFLFIGYLLVARIIIGGLAIAFGIYNLQKFIKNRAGSCEVTQTESRQRILQGIKNVALNKKLLPAIVGIVLLAFAVNLIELACSAGFPAVYTKMLAMQNLSSFSYYLYILLYIIIFMLDDMIVFAIAMLTLRLTGIDSKYARYSNLIGGAVILILGILLILKPSLLMFG